MKKDFRDATIITLALGTAFGAGAIVGAMALLGFELNVVAEFLNESKFEKPHRRHDEEGS